MSRFMTARIEVTKVAWNHSAVASALAADPKIRAAIDAKGQATASEVKAQIARSSKKPVQKRRVGGVYFSEKPSAIANTVGYKPIKDFTNKSGFRQPVGLVVADHPYSPYYRASFAVALTKAADSTWRPQGINP